MFVYIKCYTSEHMEQKIEELISRHPEWVYAEGVLSGSWKVENFVAVRELVSALCVLADELNHHPTVTFGYNTLKVDTTTHDAGNTVTQKDIDLALRISALLEK